MTPFISRDDTVSFVRKCVVIDLRYLPSNVPNGFSNVTQNVMARYRLNLCDVHPHANTRLLLPFRSNCLYRKRDVHTEHCLPMYLRTTSGCSSHVRFYFEKPHILNNEYVHVFWTLQL